MDYFYDGGARPTHAPAKVARVLSECELLAHVEPPAMTYSVQSGFMPPAFRWLGPELAACLGFDIRCENRSGPTAQLTMQALGAGKSLCPEAIEALIHDELCRLGAPGHALEAMLWARAGDPVKAERSYQEATAGGDRACWAAYQLGLWHYGAARHDEAASWFKRARGNGVDSLNQHALVLQALSLAECGRIPEALHCALFGVETIPLNPSVYAIARTCAQRLGRRDLLEHVADRQWIYKEVLSHVSPR